MRAILDPYFAARKELDELGELAVLVDDQDGNSIKEITESLEGLEKKLEGLECRHSLPI